ncbi:phosphotransferase [Sorangium sp. So ce269]
MGATSKGEHRLRSRSDFQQFCAELRTSSPKLDDLVEGLRNLAASELRAIEKSRFANSIARHLSESFDASAVRSVASVQWPPEIAMALRSHAPPQGEPVPVAIAVPQRPEGDDLRELSYERNSPPTVVLLGDEDEHRASIDQLKRTGIQCLRESSLPALHDAFGREVVVGLVVGASWWTVSGPEARPPRQRLRSILELSNLCWIKLVRSAVWTSLEDELSDLCTKVHLAHPLRSRLAVEDQATISSAELRSLTSAGQDLVYAERIFSYDFPPNPAQDRILRAAISRHLRDKYPSVHIQESGFAVRMLANRGKQGFVCLVSVADTDVAFVVKVSPYRDALEEGKRFRSFAHGTSLEMEFFCHGTQGALLFAPVGARLGDARSLEGVLASRGLVGPCVMHQRCIPLIDSAIAALQRFSGQIQTKGISTFCSVESDGTERMLASCGPIMVAGEAVDLRRIYAYGHQAVRRCANNQVVQHGDAHPGNILFSTANTAVLIDYECAGLAPACYDLSMLWIHVLASQFVAVGDEHSTVGLLLDLLKGVPFDTLQKTWCSDLRFTVNQEVVYLAHKALDASFSAMKKHGCAREDVYGIVATILCDEFLNPQFQQFTVRCALAAVSSVLTQSPT